jgi:UDP-N-acetylmuramyl tripeptide synthase
MTATGRRALLVLALAMLAGTTAAAAWADPPAKDLFFDSFTFQDTWTCPGVTITQHNEERDTITEFSPTKLRVQRHGVATLSANGKTLTSNFSAQIFQDTTTTEVKVTGTVYNIQAPGRGNILLDAGNVVFDFSTDPLTVLHLAGPHQQFSGDVGGLCDYLAGA